MEKALGLVRSLLCRECEERIGELENYFRKRFYETGPVLSLKSPGDPLRKSLVEPTFQGDVLEHVDYRLTKLFVLSLLWRCAVSEGIFAAKIQLGPHEERLGKMLLEGEPGKETDYPVLLFRIRQDSYSCEDILTQPSFIPESGGRIYGWRAGGFLMYVYVQAPLHPLTPEAHAFCLKEDGTLWLTFWSPEAISGKPPAGTTLADRLRWNGV